MMKALDKVFDTQVLQALLVINISLKQKRGFLYEEGKKQTRKT